MATAPINEKEEVLDGDRTPHLSHSRINRYLTCPEQYRLHYVEKLRPRVKNASLAFGVLMHVALADLFRNGVDPVSSFLTQWDQLKNVEIRYKARESWEDLRQKGEKLLQRFLASELRKIQNVYGVEQRFDLVLTVIPLPFVGAVDLIAHMDGETTIIDFKTAGSDYEDHEVALSDQLTAYWLAEPEADHVAFCVFVKTKEPRIEWHFAERSAGRLAEYLAKVRLVFEDIAAGKFYKRPGKHCAYCDFLPVCLGNQKKAQETLVKIA